MKIFVIDSNDCVAAYVSLEKASQHRGGTRFTTEKEFASVSIDWPMLRLVSIWNKLPGIRPVRKFTNRSIAIRRIWAALQALAAGTSTKADLVIALLTRPSGATLREIMAATGWQAHSVRGFISVTPRRLGFKVESFKLEGARVYRIR